MLKRQEIIGKVTPKVICTSTIAVVFSSISWCLACTPCKSTTQFTYSSIWQLGPMYVEWISESDQMSSDKPQIAAMYLVQRYCVVSQGFILAPDVIISRDNRHSCHRSCWKECGTSFFSNTYIRHEPLYRSRIWYVMVVVVDLAVGRCPKEEEEAKKNRVTWRGHLLWNLPTIDTNLVFDANLHKHRIYATS